jgi:isopentenyl-diphosphate delta-isomerase
MLFFAIMGVMEEVILVDTKDQQIGTMEKLEAHRQGKLHRCFSILIFDSRGRMLLQQRGLTKYHTPGLWTNACCSHQRPNEDTLAAAHRRLFEEMGFDCDLQEVYQFTYKVPFANGLWEHEYDHILVGEYNDKIVPNPEEVNDYRWVNIDELLDNINNNPDLYTPWFCIIMQKHYEAFKNKINI